MLNDVRLSYERCADLKVPGWREMNKNELVNKCCDVKDNKELYDAYVSAIIARYWNLATKYYCQNQSSAPAEECYSWLLDSIMCALQWQQWRNPKNAIYNDPNGPDKVINRCMVSARLMFYQASNCVKRKVNYQSYSAEKMQEELGDAALPAVEDEDMNRVIDVSDDLIIKAFRRGDYFSAAVIDNIAHKETYDIIKEGGKVFTKFNPKKLARVLRRCDDAYCDAFSRRYHVNVDDMREQVTTIKRFSSEKMYRWINRSLEKLRKDKGVQEMFG